MLGTLRLHELMVICTFRIWDLRSYLFLLGSLDPTMTLYPPALTILPASARPKSPLPMTAIVSRPPLPLISMETPSPLPPLLVSSVLLPPARPASPLIKMRFQYIW